MTRSIPSRLPDWRPRLVSYLHACARSPFAYGHHDCALFLAGGVAAMTGCDPSRKYRGAYDSLSAGRRLLKADGFDGHVSLARAHLTSKPVSMACEGDGAVLREGRQWALGIVQGARIYVLRSSGLGLVPLTAAHDVLEV